MSTNMIEMARFHLVGINLFLKQGTQLSPDNDSWYSEHDHLSHQGNCQSFVKNHQSTSEK